MRIKGLCGAVLSVALIVAASFTAARPAAALPLRHASRAVEPDTTPPTCVVTSREKWNVRITVQDSQSGIAAVTSTDVTNAKVTVAPFTPGTTNPVNVKVTRLVWAKRTATIVVTDVVGNSRRCSVSAQAPLDTDGDGVPDATDNCPLAPNRDQSNRYGSPKGDACEDDSNGDGILDINEPDMCVSVDGVVIIQHGLTPLCGTTHTTGTKPNIAVATGWGSNAAALRGDNNTATANGWASSAGATDGNNNTARAEGDWTVADAYDGSNNTAIDNGWGGDAEAGLGDNNTAIASHAGTALAFGDNNTAIANGVCVARAEGNGIFVSCP